METELTFRDLLNRARALPTGDMQLRLMAAENNAEYLAQVERALTVAISELVANRKYKQDTSEDGRTVQIVSMLRMAGLNAIHDAKIGGHTDISIRLGDNFLWIGEAKNWRGSAWAFKGFRQLLTRYATGLDGQENGAIILYIEESNATGLLKKWRLNLEKLATALHRVADVTNLRFTSIHTHAGAGTPFTVRHLAVPLYFDPDDD